MKTLAEVIKRLEDDLHATEADSQLIMLFDRDVVDALHYLKEYRTEKKTLRDSKEHYEYWEHKYYAELEKNDPLSWDELKQMEGMPVWVELPEFKKWGLNAGTYVDAFCHENITIKVLHDLWHLDKEQMGKSWQAYRKERE